MRASKYWTYVYFFQSTVPPYLIKIGESGRPLRRLRDLMIGSPVELIPVYLIKANVLAEAMLHFAFEDQRAHGEWFHPHPNLKRLVRGWKGMGAHLLTPDLADTTLPEAATHSGDSPQAVGAALGSLADYLGYYRIAFEVDGIGSGSQSARRATLAWRNTQVVKCAQTDTSRQ